MGCHVQNCFFQELDKYSFPPFLLDTETNQEINDEMKESEAHKQAIGEEHQKDYTVPVPEKTLTHESDEQLGANVNQMTETIEEASAAARKGKAVVNVSETNGGLITSLDNEKAGTEENCKEHPQILDEGVSEPAKPKTFHRGDDDDQEVLEEESSGIRPIRTSRDILGPGAVRPAFGYRNRVLLRKAWRPVLTTIEETQD
uniref:Uncharacterized protein n=1 Tax=Kalanchoe fedtschenkoi TaxID=63787 RepID=A0A7N0TCZ9_KALFE